MCTWGTFLSRILWDYRTVQFCYATKSDNIVHELTAIKVVCTLLQGVTTVQVYPHLQRNCLKLFSKASAEMPFETTFQLVLWNYLLSCHFITTDIINVIKMYPL